MRDVFLLMVAVALAMFCAREVFAAPGAACPSSGFAGGQGTGNLWCQPAACQDGAGSAGTCAAMQGSQPHPIYGTYNLCGCGGTEPNCCHLIQGTKGSPATQHFAAIGDCLAQNAACPPGNTCALTGTGTGGQGGSPWKQECVQQAP